MFKNRFLLVLGLLFVLVVTMAISRPFASVARQSDVEVFNESQSYPNPGAARNIGLDVTDYHIRHPEPNVEEAQSYVMDSATRSYIARGEALEAAGKLRASGACSNTSRENVFERIDPTLDSATRSYIDRGLASQAKHDIRASCGEVPVDFAESNSPIDECFDVSLSEVAACRASIQSPAP